MRIISLIAIGFLAILLNCAKTPVGQGQLYEIQIFLLKGGHNGGGPQLPLFPGETSIHILEKLIAGEDGVEKQLRRTFGYSRVELLTLRAFPFFQRDRQQAFSVNISADKTLSLILFPGTEAEFLPFSINLMGKEKSENGSAKDENSLFSLRADVPLQKGLVLGRALPDAEDGAMFLLLQPLAQPVHSADEFISAMEKYQSLDEIYASDMLESFFNRAGELYGEAEKMQAFYKKYTAIFPVADADSAVAHDQLTKPAKLIKMISPKYPEVARKNGLVGVSFISMLVSEKGEVLRAEVRKSSGTAALDSAALSAAKQFQFEPGEVNGRQVRVKLTIPINFKLKK